MYTVIMIMNDKNLICIIIDVIQISRMRWNNTNNINKEAPIACIIRINQSLFMFNIIYIIESYYIVNKSL